MNYVHEYALLAAVAMPCAAIVGINVRLWLSGERGTLLVPSFGMFPSVIDVRKAIEDSKPLMTAAQQALAEAVPANDMHVREAA